MERFTVDDTGWSECHFLKLSNLELLCILSNLLLAIKHPANYGPSVDLTKVIARAIRDIILSHFGEWIPEEAVKSWSLVLD